MQSVFIRNYCL